MKYLLQREEKENRINVQREKRKPAQGKVHSHPRSEVETYVQNFGSIFFMTYKPSKSWTVSSLSIVRNMFQLTKRQKKCRNGVSLTRTDPTLWGGYLLARLLAAAQREIIETLLGNASANDRGKACGKPSEWAHLTWGRFPAISAYTILLAFILSSVVFPLEPFHISIDDTPRCVWIVHGASTPVSTRDSSLHKRERKREKWRTGRMVETLRLDYKRKKIYNPREIHTHFAPSTIKGCAVLSPVFFSSWISLSRLSALEITREQWWREQELSCAIVIELFSSPSKIEDKGE